MNVLVILALKLRSWCMEGAAIVELAAFRA